MIGWFQSAWPLWLAMISESRQIGLLGAFHGVIGTGLGDQLYQICASSWAKAGASAMKSAAATGSKLRDFIKNPPQTSVFVSERMSSLVRRHNRSNQRPSAAKGCSMRLATFLSGRVGMKVHPLLLTASLTVLLCSFPAGAQTIVTLAKGYAHGCYVYAKAGTDPFDDVNVC